MRTLSCRRSARYLGSTRRLRREALVVLVSTVSLLTGSCAESYEDSPSTSEQSAQRSESEKDRRSTQPRFNKPSRPMPAHGSLFWLDSASNTAIMQENIRQGEFGQLRISVPPGRRSYYVKLKELRPRRGEVLGAVIGAGRTLTIDVPLDGYGTTIYDVRYGAGTTWYGQEFTFGPQGLYATADETFAFEEGSGWEVELIARPGGNLGTSGLGYANF